MQFHDITPDPNAASTIRASLWRLSGRGGEGGSPPNENGMLMMMALAVIAFLRLSHQVHHLGLMTSVTSPWGRRLPGEKNTTESRSAVCLLPAARLCLPDTAVLLSYIRTCQGQTMTMSAWKEENWVVFFFCFSRIKSFHLYCSGNILM